MGVSASRSSEDVATRRVGPDDAPAAPAMDGATAGAMIGRYVVLERIGEGGMGVVLRAYDPKLRREVALKRLRQGAIEPTAEARLVREAQAMARLNHPNVVAVYDIESSADGVFVAMELVRGTTLREHLAAQPRSWREIVRCFVAAGRGLAAAHHMGLVHRDFKPTNVLVADDGRIEVGDFGLARSTGSVSTDEPAGTTARDEGDPRLTQAGIVHGTPRYMAPEQLGGGDVGVHADQYAFCVALWEALCGKPPFVGDSKSLQAAKREGPPSWPRPRGVPTAIGSALRRGLATDPGQRWPDMDALLVELGRDPARRNRALAGLGIGVALVAGLFAWQWADERQRLAACAEAAAFTPWSDAIADATAERIAAHGGVGAVDTWTRVRPVLDAWAASWQAVHEQHCVAAVHDARTPRPHAEATYACLDEHRERFAAVIEALGADDREVVSTALTSAASLPPLTECTDELVLGQRAPLPDDADVRAAIGDIRRGLAGVDVAIATAQYAHARQRADELRERAEALGWAPVVAEVHLRRGAVHSQLADTEAAREAYTEAFYGAGTAGHDVVALRAATQLVRVVGVHGSEHAEGLRWAELGRMLVTRLKLEGRGPEADLFDATADLHRMRGAYPEARIAAERALAIDEALFGADHLRTVSDLESLGTIELDAGSIDAAHAAFTRAAEVREAVQGPQHPTYGVVLMLVANTEFARGDYAKALSTTERVEEIQRAALGDGCFQLAKTFEVRGNILQQTGEYDAAMAAYGEAERIIVEHRGDASIQIARLWNNMAIALNMLGRPAEALAKLQRALAIRESVLAADHPEIGRNLHSIGVAYGEMGDFASSLPYFERALAIRERAFGPDHAEVALTLVGIARIHMLMKNPELGIPFAERALAITREQLGAEHVDVASMEIRLAELRMAAGDLEGATAVAEHALAIRDDGEVTPYERAEAKFTVGQLLSRRGIERERARELLTSARDELRALQLPQHMDTLAEAEQLLKRLRG